MFQTFVSGWGLCSLEEVGGDAAHSDECAAEDERGDRHQLDKDVDGWTTGVLHWVTNCVANDSRFVRF